MTAFGCVPRASTWPCARWVEPKTSPSSIAAHTPTSAASWPIATCRNPGSSPARKRSSTFSSNRLIRSISRRKSRSRSSDKARFFSTFATTLSVRSAPMALVKDWQELCSTFPERWTESRVGLTLEEAGDSDRVLALLAPLQPVRTGPGSAAILIARQGGGPSPELLRRSLQRLDAERLHGRLELISIDEGPAADSTT